MGHDVAVVIGRSRQILRTRHHRWRIVSRTSNRAGGRRRSDANPCPGTNQEERGDGTTEQDDLAHVNSGRYATRREYSVVLICGFGMCLKSQDVHSNALSNALSQSELICGQVISGLAAFVMPLPIRSSVSGLWDHSDAPAIRGAWPVLAVRALKQRFYRYLTSSSSSALFSRQ